MTAFRLAFAGILLSGLTVLAADGPIRLPVSPVVPTPMPSPPSPDAKVGLLGDQWYVIESKVECIVRGYPAGLVTVASKKGPRDISAKFVDGTGGVEDRSYDGPFIYVVRAIGKGDCSLVITPVGVKTGADILVASLAVDSGMGPIPPPKPVDPEPKVEPVTSFRVILIYESADTLTPEQNGVLYGKAVEEYLTKACTGGKSGWDRRDKDKDPATDTTPLKDAWASTKPAVTGTPCVAIVVNNKVTIEPLPTSADAAITLFKKYGGK